MFLKSLSWTLYLSVSNILDTYYLRTKSVREQRKTKRKNKRKKSGVNELKEPMNFKVGFKHSCFLKYAADTLTLIIRILHLHVCFWGFFVCFFFFCFFMRIIFDVIYWHTEETTLLLKFKPLSATLNNKRENYSKADFSILNYLILNSWRYLMALFSTYKLKDTVLNVLKVTSCNPPLIVSWW